LLGVIYHWTGGLAAASFYIPYRAVRRWSWETYWLVGGVFSWIIAPWTMALLLVPDARGAIRATPTRSVLWAYAFGVLWGLGGLTFGLTVRYLGIALGVAVALGLCNAFGTLMPPIFSGDFGEILRSRSGQIILLGVLASIAGIAICGAAGVSKEAELSPAQKHAAIPEFDFGKGMLVATFSGVMSACFAYGLAAGQPLADAARRQLLIVVLAGGFTTNLVWCVALNIKNGTARQYLGLGGSMDGPGAAMAGSPLLRNYLWSALAGFVWYLQFFCYGMGAAQMGRYGFSSWTLHMASIIIFSTLWGIALNEWKGTSGRTHALIGAGLAILVGSTLVVGYGNYIKSPTWP
jgi:L-rhamnose-H+ transport protein